MARILDPQPGMTVYDPACGSAGLLIKQHLRLLETHGIAMNEHRELPKNMAPLKLFGQEINPSTFAMSVMNAFLHDMDATIELGDTIRNPAFVEARRLQQFDLVVANPMWNQDFAEDVYRNDNWERFGSGIPPASSADWGWVQHMVASLKPRGRMAVVLDTGAAGRGSGAQGANRERDIRKRFVDDDLVEAIVLLPDNMFYNTSAPAVVMVFDRAKKHPGEVILINASAIVTKGRPKNFWTDSQIAEVERLYSEWSPVDGRAAVLTTSEIVDGDYTLSPSRYVSAASDEVALPLDEAVRLLRDAEAARDTAVEEMWKVLAEMGAK